MLSEHSVSAFGDFDGMLFHILVRVYFYLANSFDHSNDVAQAVMNRREDGYPTGLVGDRDASPVFQYSLHLRNHFAVKLAPVPELAHFVFVAYDQLHFAGMPIDWHPQIHVAGERN